MMKNIFILFCVFELEARIALDKAPASVNVASAIVSQFSDYSFIFHFDNTTQQIISAIMRASEINTSYFTMNYDAPTGNGRLLQRPPGYRFMHVVLLNDYAQFQRYTSSHSFNLEHVDVIVFAINQRGDCVTPGFALWQPNTLSQAGTVFIADGCDSSVYTVCFFCGNNSNVVRKIDGDATSLKVHTNQFEDFNGHVFDVACTMYRPFFWCVKENRTCVSLHGTEGQLLSLLAVKLNFKPNMIDFSGIEDAWAAMINSVKELRVHWAVGGISVTVKRNKVVDFTDFIRPEPYTAIFSVYEDIWMSWQNILVPFEMALWLSLIITVVILATLMYSTIKITHANQQLHYLFYIQGCFRFLVEQGFPSFPDVLKTRCTTVWLMFLWWMMALIITNAYKSKLTSSLINFKVDEPSSVDELVQRGFYFQTNKEDSSVLRENLASAADPSFLAALKRSKNDLDLCPSIMSTIGRKVAVIEEETTLQYEVLTNCRQLMTLQQQQDLRLIRDELFPSTHAWPLQLSCPYRQRLSRLISRLHAAGMFAKWYRDSLMSGGKLVPKSHQSQGNAQTEIKFNLVTILGPILLWLLGIVVSAICFMAEMMYKRKID